MLASGCSTVVKHLSHYTYVKDLSTAAVAKRQILKYLKHTQTNSLYQDTADLNDREAKMAATC
jgi:hypothetical protein